MQTDKAAEQSLKQQLAKHHMRITHVRLEIFRKLHIANQPLSIQDIAKRIKTAHFVSVYRSVDSMSKAGILKLVPQGFKNLYELSDIFMPHHHHATCKVCGKTKEIHDDRIEVLMRNLAIGAGLKPTEHQFELFGICKSCQELTREPKQGQNQ